MVDVMRASSRSSAVSYPSTGVPVPQKRLIVVHAGARDECGPGLLGLGAPGRPGEKDAELAQKLGQPQPLLAVFPEELFECMGQLASLRAT
jgi:hypothetical protein